AVRARRDAPGAAVVRGHGVLGEHALRGDPTDLVGAVLSEPEVAVGPAGDGVGGAVGCGDGILREGPLCRDPADVPSELGEPQGAVRPGRDVVGIAVVPGYGELLDPPGRLGRDGRRA